MNWFTNLFKSKGQGQEIVHPVFGRMVSIKCGDGMMYWESVEEVESEIGPVQVFVDGDENGPFENLVTQWAKIVAEFDYWKRKAEPKLRESLRDFGNEGRYNDLTITCFGMYEPGREPIDWDMSFELDAKVFHYTVCFKNDEVTLVTADS